MTLSARFWVKVQVTDTCWLWTGCLNSKGYGVVSIGGRRHLTHRVAYEALVGPIPDGFTIDHVKPRCESTRCLNPDHLEPVTSLENRQRANRLITTCRRGHPLSKRPGDRQRRCRECESIARDQKRLVAVPA